MSTDTQEDCFHRRHLLCGGGALMFGAILASLLGGSKPARAQAIPGTVPEVDAVSVRVVVDSYQFAVAASKKVGSVDVQHFGWGLSKKPRWQWTCAHWPPARPNRARKQ